MNLICESDNCTGCGMCSNICPQNAVSMVIGHRGFVFPQIDKEKCVDCGLCEKKCPVNQPAKGGRVIKIYAAWNKKNSIRKKESSGGVFSLLATEVLQNGGVVFGVAWSEEFLPEHIKVDCLDDMPKLYSSKYAQSNTGDIFQKVKECLLKNKRVLFSGTPCQVAGLYNYLGKKYDELCTIDLVCHGVPSANMLRKYYKELNIKSKLTDVNFRHKDPNWDYEYVTMKCGCDTIHHKLTIEDSYFNLFNIGYSLRESCHHCKYTNLNRMGDITLADYWGFRPHSFKTLSYNKGTSLVLINSSRGMEIFDAVKNGLYFEERTIDNAKKTNKCLYEPFSIDQNKLYEFWQDYENGMSIADLDDKYTANTFTLPNHIALRRLYTKWKWVIGR